VSTRAGPSGEPEPPSILVRHDTNVWSTEYQVHWPVRGVPIAVRTTIIRLVDGRLIVHSPGPVSSGLRESLAALGPVAFIVAPRMHGKFAAQAAEQYPTAEMLAAPRAPSRRAAPVFSASLADRPPAAWEGQIECHRLLGFRLDEVVLFHRPSRSLLITDLCFNIQHSPSRISRAVFRADGIWQQFGPGRIIPLLGISDRTQFQRSLEQVLRWDFDRIIPGHGSVIEHGGPTALRRAWRI
jgi:hypothetical protein